MSFSITTNTLGIKQALISLVGLGTGIDAGVPQTDTVTIDIAEALVQYDITLTVKDIDGNVLATHTISFTAGAAPTLEEIRDGLIASAVASDDFSAVATVKANSTDKIDLTAVLLGDALNTAVADDGSGSAISVALKTAFTNGSVLWGEQDEERIALDTDFEAFAQLVPTSDGLTFGDDEIKRDFVVGKQERRTEGWRQMNLTVDVFTRRVVSLATKDARDLLRDFGTMIPTQQALAITKAGRISILSHSAVRNQSALLGEQWETRASMDLVLLYVVGTLETDSPFVETVGPITEADGTLIVNT